MKLVFLTLACLFLVMPSYAAETAVLPKELLGYWEPRSKSTGGGALDITPSGELHTVHIKTAKIIRSSSYQLLFQEKGKAYLAVDSGKKDSDLWILSVTYRAPNTNILEIDIPGCVFNLQELSRIPADRIQTFLAGNKCPDGGVRDESEGWGMVFGRPIAP